MDFIAIASLIVGIIALYFAWLQIDYRFKKKNPQGESKDILTNILEKKIIRVGWFNYPPFIQQDQQKSNVPIGLYPLITQEVAIKFDLEIKWKFINLSESVETIKENKVDVVLSVFQTPNRARQVDFTCFMHSIIVGGVAKKSINDIHSQSELLRSNYSITVAKNEIGHELVEAIKIPRSRITIIDTNDISKIIGFVKSGETDLVLLDSVSIKNYFRNNAQAATKNIKQIFIRRPLAICHNGIMIPQNQIEFANWLDTEFRLVRDREDITAFENLCLTDYQAEVSKS